MRLNTSWQIPPLANPDGSVHLPPARTWQTDVPPLTLVSAGTIESVNGKPLARKLDAFGKSPPEDKNRAAPARRHAVGDAAGQKLAPSTREGRFPGRRAVCRCRSACEQVAPHGGVARPTGWPWTSERPAAGTGEGRFPGAMPLADAPLLVTPGGTGNQFSRAGRLDRKRWLPGSREPVPSCRRQRGCGIAMGSLNCRMFTVQEFQGRYEGVLER
jgi:hypothetical protein